MVGCLTDVLCSGLGHTSAIYGRVDLFDGAEDLRDRNVGAHEVAFRRDSMASTRASSSSLGLATRASRAGAPAPSQP